MQVINPFIVVGAEGIEWIEYVVGNIGTGYAVFIDLVGDSDAGMVQRLLDDLDALAFV